MSDILQILGKLGAQVDKKMLELLSVNAAEDFREVVFHQVQAGGKRIRPALAITFCEAANGERESALSAAAAIELIHNYSLILDDIIDDADVRRNLPTTWKKYGLNFGILASTHYREAIEEGVLQSPNPLSIARIVADTIRELVEGERLDVLFEQLPSTEEYTEKHRYHNVSLKDYETMIGYKTAALIRAACEVGVICAGGSKEMQTAAREFGWKAGIAFQMADDVLDLFAEETKLGKKLGKDIYEHKLGNIVMLHSLSLLSEADHAYVLNILRSPNPTESAVMKVIGLLKQTRATQIVQKEAQKLVIEAKQALEVFPNKKATNVLSTLVDFIYQRSF
ncbi:MAG: polyprenyl synthetase family protein [Candidatus Thorarchaeota archaeon]